MTLRTFTKIWSPQLRNRRDVDVYLPPSYSAGRERYPVVYMQDGQNLSDPDTAFAGTWELDATLERLAARGIEAIVVGVHHAGAARLVEYSPFPDRRHGGGKGGEYLAFLVETIKPRVDRLFRTRAGPESTAILGSSMGGLISLYAVLTQHDVFGAAGVMSPSLWFGQGRVFELVQTAPARGRIYLDVGTLEGTGTLRDVRRLGRMLVRRGFRRDCDRKVGLKARTPRVLQTFRSASRATTGTGVLRYVEQPGGRHREGDWARRLEDALAFLLGYPWRT